MILKQIARELIDITSAIVRGRTINVMDTDGVILASTDKARVGTVHFGAKEAVRTARMIEITKEQIPQYPGSKEGCNMPLRLHGSIIGVVGIYGNPHEVEDLARLLEIYIEKHVELETYLYQRNAENDLRRQLFHLLVNYRRENQEYITSLAGSLEIEIALPCRAVIITDSASKGNTLDSADYLRSLLDELLSKGIFHRHTDLFYLEGSHLYLLQGHVWEDNSRFWETFYKRIKEIGSFHVSVGSVCSDIEDIRQSYREAASLDQYEKDGLSIISNPVSRINWFLSLTASDQTPYLKSLWGRLSSQFRPEELSSLLHSAECYYQEERSISKAASILFIHKNTLQYRLHRLLEAMELDKVPGFYQEYMVRLILQFVRDLPKEERT